MLDYVHTHSLDILNAGDEDSEPVFLIPPGADLEALRGGPEVVFDGLMPKPGTLSRMDAVPPRRHVAYVHDDVRGSGAGVVRTNRWGNAVVVGCIIVLALVGVAQGLHAWVDHDHCALRPRNRPHAREPLRVVPQRGRPLVSAFHLRADLGEARVDAH